MGFDNKTEKNEAIIRDLDRIFNMINQISSAMKLLDSYANSLKIHIGAPINSEVSEEWKRQYKKSVDELEEV